MSEERHHHTCGRCSYTWYGKAEPKLCVRCKSPYWNKARVRKIKKQLAAA